MPPAGRVIALVEHGFEDIELFYPRFRLEEEGYEVYVATPDGVDRKGEHGYRANASLPIEDADPDDYVAILLPGGVASPDKLRMDEDAVEFVARYVEETPGNVFAICHAPWLLVEADVVEGVELTSYWSLRTDLENAGATWRDEPVVVDRRFVTSRYPKDLPVFGRAITEALAELEHEVMTAAP